MAVCMYLCTSPGSPCDAPGDVSGQGFALTSSKSDTQKDHTDLGKGRVILAPIEPLDTYRVPTGCPRSWARVFNVWAAQTLI